MNFVNRKLIGTIFILISIGTAVLVGTYVSLNKDNIQSITKAKLISPFTNKSSIFSFFLKKPRPKNLIYGYLPYWSIDKAEYMQFDKLTDIAYFGLYINSDGTFMKILEDGTTEPGYNNWHNNEDLTKLIDNAQKADVRVALTVIAHTDDTTDKFLDCEECWKTLAENLKTEMEVHKVKDVNLNFEYANFDDEKKDKTEKYTKYVTFIKGFLVQNYPQSFLVVSTFADNLIRTKVTDVEQVGKVADALFIMGYDFHRPDSDTAGPVAPIDGIGIHADYDIRTMLKDYLTVVPPSKIILGVPYYGYNWLVAEDKEYAERKPGTEEAGYSQSQAYSDIMDTIIELKPEVKWDALALVPYFGYVSPETNERRMVYFENVDSLKEKYDLVKTNKLAGVGIWALGYDGGYQELWDLLKKEFLP